MKTKLTICILVAGGASFPAQAQDRTCNTGTCVYSGTNAIPAVPSDTHLADYYPTWHLLTKSHGGTVSLIKGLTKHECEYARARALRLPATDAEKKEDEIRQAGHKLECLNHPKSWDCHDGDPAIVSPGDIETAECFE